MSVKIAKWSPRTRKGVVLSFLQRPAFETAAESAAEKVLRDVRISGNKAVLQYVKKFDGTVLNSASMKVSNAELRAASKLVDSKFRNAVKETLKRVKAFSRASVKKDWSMNTKGKGLLGEKFSPLDRVGVYVPGGAAPLASTAVMTVPIAKVAGVKEVVACTPCDRTGLINPFTLYAIGESGASEIYKVGGIQAIGMMAYGTETVRRVQKIVGPGGPYVTAAKRQVYGVTALDLVAGPSEIAIIADDSADPRFVAADLLSQAEHGSGSEKALLLTTSMTLAKNVQTELESQSKLLNRQGPVQKVMKNGMLLVVTDSISHCVELCNKFAPEHLELMTKRPRALLKKITCAGAIFLGKWTPEAVGDFVAGPSHVLPTGGAAAMFSGLTVDDFQRRSSFIEFSKSDLKTAIPVIDAFGRVEGLDAHARSAGIRFDSK